MLKSPANHCDRQGGRTLFSVQLFRMTKLIRTAGGAQKGVRPARVRLALRPHHLSNRTLLRRLETPPWGRYCCKSPRGVARPGRFGNNRIRIADSVNQNFRFDLDARKLFFVPAPKNVLQQYRPHVEVASPSMHPRRSLYAAYAALRPTDVRLRGRARSGRNS